VDLGHRNLLGNAINARPQLLGAINIARTVGTRNVRNVQDEKLSCTDFKNPAESDDRKLESETRGPQSIRVVGFTAFRG
jgi:hypothetical protein